MLHAHRHRFALTLLWLTIAVACARPASIETPEGKRAYDANEVVKRINEFQAATIAAADAKQLDVAVSRKWVEWCVQARGVMKEAPVGWDAVLRKLWGDPAIPGSGLRAEVAKNETLSHWVIVFDALLGLVQ